MISLGGLTVTPVRAGKGDCIKINYDGNNIIVDSGPPSTAGEFRTICNSILSNNESLDVLILTHYDDRYTVIRSFWKRLE